MLTMAQQYTCIAILAMLLANCATFADGLAIKVNFDGTKKELSITPGPPRGAPGLNKKQIVFDKTTGEMKNQNGGVEFTVPAGITITHVAHLAVPMDGFRVIEAGGAHSSVCLKGTKDSEEVYFMTDMLMESWRFVKSTAERCPADDKAATGNNVRGGGWSAIEGKDLRDVWDSVVNVIKGNSYNPTEFNCWKYAKVVLDALGASPEAFLGQEDSIKTTFQTYMDSEKIVSNLEPLVTELFGVQRTPQQAPEVQMSTIGEACTGSAEETYLAEDEAYETTSRCCFEITGAQTENGEQVKQVRQCKVPETDAKKCQANHPENKMCDVAVSEADLEPIIDNAVASTSEIAIRFKTGHSRLLRVNTA